MRYAQIRSMDISNGEGVGIALFVQGCPFHCKNCFNKETWDFDGGKEFTDNIKNDFLQMAIGEYIDRISILGGEPLCNENYNTILSLVKELPKDKKIWIYTGYSYPELKSLNKDEILKYIDVLVDGRYVDELKDFNLDFRGSSNQHIIKLNRGGD